MKRLERRPGNGAAIFLNLDMHDYAQLRGSGTLAAGYIDLFDEIFRRDGLTAAVKVRGPRPVAVFRYGGGSTEYLALIRNPEPGGPLLPRPDRITLTFPKAVAITDLLRNLDLGPRRTLDLDLEPTAPILLKLRHPVN